MGRLSLADGLIEGGAGRNRQLDRTAALVDWAAFERLVGEVPNPWKNEIRRNAKRLSPIPCIYS
jgi:hypothetical protein